MQIRFGEHEIDDERFVLLRGGERLAIRPMVFDLLVHLVRHRERVVLRDELVLALWGTTAVGPGSLSGLVNELRQMLGEAGRDTSSIRTVHARGYQFVAPLVVVPHGVGTSVVWDAPERVQANEIDRVRSRSPSRVDAALASILSSFERAGSVGARAALVMAPPGHERTALMQTATAALLKAGFETCLVPRADGRHRPETDFLDGLLAGVIEAYGIGRLRSMTSSRSHELFERHADEDSFRALRPTDPLAARQYDDRIRRSMAELLQALARQNPLAMIAADEVVRDETISALTSLLRLLGDSRIFILAPIFPADSWDESESMVEPIHSKIDRVVLSAVDRGELDILLSSRGIAALPSLLADALIAHVHDDVTSLEAIANWLYHEEKVQSSNPEYSTTPSSRVRMRRVEPVSSGMRSRLETR